MFTTRRITNFALLTTIAALVGFSFPTAAQAQRTDIRKQRIPWEGRTIYVRDLVGWGFKKFILPKSFNKFGVSVRLDEVKVKRVETDFRGGFWITVKAKYKGGYDGFGDFASEDLWIHFDAGHVRLDVGSLKGILNTRSVARTMGNFLPQYLQPRLHAGSGPSPTGLNAGQYQQQANQMVARGMMPRTVSVTNYRGQLLYNVSWQPKNGRQFSARHGLTEHQFRSVNADLQRRGFRLAQQSSTVLNGNRIYIAYWVK